jgi:hypothetical protein
MDRMRQRIETNVYLMGKNFDIYASVHTFGFGTRDTTTSLKSYFS